MPNLIDPYDQIQYTEEALIMLENQLGIAPRVHMDYSKADKQPGSTMEITRPGTFIAKDMPDARQDIKPDLVEIKFNIWKGVTFGVNDQEMNYSTQKILDDHVQPAVYALTNYLDEQMAAEILKCPWEYDMADPILATDIPSARRVMRNNKVPLGEPARMHMMADGKMEEDWLKDTAFTQNQGSGDIGVSAQITGDIGRRFGYGIFANQNAPLHTGGTAVPTGDMTASGAHAAGVALISLTAATSLTGDVVAGDTFVVAGNRQRHCILNAVTAATDVMAAVQITPPLPDALDGTEVITLKQQATEVSCGFGFHRNWLAFAIAPLGDYGNGNGAQIVQRQSDQGYALRSRTWYDPDAAENLVSFDVLCGIKQLDPNLAVRMNNPTP